MAPVTGDETDPRTTEPFPIDALLDELAVRTGGRSALRAEELAGYAARRVASLAAATRAAGEGGDEGGDEDTCVLCDAPNDVCDPCDAGDIRCTGQRDIVCVTCDTADTCTEGDLCSGKRDICVACDTAKDPCTVADVL